MLSAICFDLDQSKILLSGNSLTLYHTRPTFNTLAKEGFGKHCGKKRKCWEPAFSSFPAMFSILSQREIVTLTTFNLSSANAFTLVMSKNLSFGKGLNMTSSSATFENIGLKEAITCYKLQRQWPPHHLMFSKLLITINHKYSVELVSSLTTKSHTCMLATLEKEDFPKFCGKRRKCFFCSQCFLLFLHLPT